MRRGLSRAVVLTGMLVFTEVARAQTTFIGAAGTLYRYHADTIWQERDTTLMRTVIRGDTVASLYTMNGVMRYEVTYVVRGDSGRLIDARYGAGFEQPSYDVAKTAPAAVVLMQYTMLENELRMAASRAQMRAVLPDREPPRSPDPARAYNVSAEVRITQHRDTVFFVRGCPSLGRVDTTVFLMFGEDSVRRVSRPERTFGKAMNLSLTNQMRMVLTRERIKARETPLPPDFPRPPGGCP